ncbi:MAG: CBS domain-containing protein [Oscillospiraceae bacterium]
MNILFFLKPKNEVAYLRDDCTIRQALEKMKHNGYTALPLIDKDGHYTGTVTEGDFLWYLLGKDNAELKAAEQSSIRDLHKSTQNLSVSVNAKLEDLLLMMMNQNFVPVTDDRGIFIGIVTRKDIIGHFYLKATEYRSVSV